MECNVHVLIVASVIQMFHLTPYAVARSLASQQMGEDEQGQFSSHTVRHRSTDDDQISVDQISVQSNLVGETKITTELRSESNLNLPQAWSSFVHRDLNRRCRFYVLLNFRFRRIAVIAKTLNAWFELFLTSVSVLEMIWQDVPSLRSINDTETAWKIRPGSLCRLLIGSASENYR